MQVKYDGDKQWELLCDEGRDSVSPPRTSANTFLICRSHIKYCRKGGKKKF